MSGTKGGAKLTQSVFAALHELLEELLEVEDQTENCDVSTRQRTITNERHWPCPALCSPQNDKAYQKPHPPSLSILSAGSLVCFIRREGHVSSIVTTPGQPYMYLPVWITKWK